MRLGVAQSFLESSLAGISPQIQASHEPDSLDLGAQQCACCCRCGRGRELKPTGLRVKRKSRSYSPIRTGVSELSGWLVEPPSLNGASDARLPTDNAPGESSLERLPVEILNRIITELTTDIPPAGNGPRNVDLSACLLTSRTIHVATLPILYRFITIPHSNIFSKFLGHISKYPNLGKLARRLDLSHFTSLGLGRTNEQNNAIQNMSSKTLLACLNLTPALQEVLFQYHLENDIDGDVIRKLFFGHSNLRALDFCGSWSQNFVTAFSSVCSSPIFLRTSVLEIRRLSLHECSTLPSSTLELLLPRLPKLTHLDLCHTKVSDKALASIPRSAKLTHLNLSRCSQMTGDGVVDFLTDNPAVANLVYLNLCCDTKTYRLLSETNIDRLLPLLPDTLRSLNLGGARIRASHRSRLLPLTKHLEELGLGFADLSMSDLNSLFIPRPPKDDLEGISYEELAWTPSTLHYLDLTGVPSVTISGLFSSTCVLLEPLTSPLEVLELSDKIIAGLNKCTATNKQLGWCVKELGKRGWYVREPTAETVGRSTARPWKMGAMWWGMRKIPVAHAEVGGPYGHYMFKK
ncbi:MAG: hypothetical protein MMC33_004214 [Icmadophila ericetorum]|nr:hypothetical protein [Icmadophila ericetorum]